jgi:hypothetical protein
MHLRASYGFMRPFSYGRMLSMRGDFVLGLLFCLVAGPAVAQSPYTPEQLAVAFAKGWRPLQPPTEFAGPYEGVLTVIGVPLAEIPSKCRNPRNIACAYWAYDLTRCTIYIPNDVTAKLREAILAHETGHCLGWKHPQPEAPAVKMEIDRGIAVKRALTNPVCLTVPKPEACP